MKKLLSIYTLLAATILFVGGCRKVENLPFYSNGNAVSLTASKASVVPSAADSNSQVISFSWTNPKYASDSNTYKYVLEIDSTGRNFAKKVTIETIGKLSTSITGRQLNNILLNYGFTLGTPYTLDARVVSSYNNNNERLTSNAVTFSVTPFSDPSTLATSSTSVTGTLATSTALSNTFTWTPSFVGYTGAVTYSIQYDSATKNFATPKEIAVGTGVFSKALTQGEMNQTALDVKIPGGNIGKVDYRIKATTALGAVAYSNVVSVTIQTYFPLLRLYMPGSYQGATGNGNDWDPPTAPEFIRDLRPGVLNQLYYMYIYLPANTEFKITPARDWNTAYGGSGGNLSTSGGNLSVSTAGVYRISVDMVNMKYDIREGRMGFVGGATGAGWNPPNVFPTYGMGYGGRNVFVGLTDLTTDAWKLIDNNTWNDGSNSVAETRSYGSAGPSGSTVEVNGPNFPNITTAGRYRAIWDGRNPDNVKYDLSPATEMRLVGDGINQAGVNDWDPGSSPQMAYQGNGVWTITIALKANKDIKFLAGNAWGAFDYEDAGAGSGAGTRKIKWDGSDNFKTPATAGTYTITLNEYTQTMTIN